MTKDELVHLLTAEMADAPGTALVVLSKDGEGNGFSPLHTGEHMRYEAESDWSGTARDLLDPDDEEEDDGSVDAVVLWPRN